MKSYFDGGLIQFLQLNIAAPGKLGAVFVPIMLKLFCKNA